MEKNKLAKEILNYWYVIELLTQEKFPVQDKFSKKTTDKIRQYSMSSNETMGTNQLAKTFSIYSTLNKEFEIDDIIEKGDKYYHFHKEISSIGHICYGKVEREYIVQKLYEVLNIQDNRHEQAVDKICLFSFKRNIEGEYKMGSFQLSPLIWGLYQCYVNKESTNKDMTHTSYRRLLEDLEKKLPTDKKINNEFIQFIYKEIYEAFILPLQLEKYTYNEGVFVYSRFMSEKVKEKEDERLPDISELAQSFYSEDLSLVSKHFEKNLELNDMRSRIVDYITDKFYEEEKYTHLVRDRIDIRADQRAIESALSVENISLGKWPSKFKPALMQQVAINHTTLMEDIQTIFSVNGPPGTGKTTLLKEIIAHNIVERAIKLSTVERADKAFDASYFYDTDNKKCYYDQYITRYYSFKDSSINNHSMLVASNNNAAVENITVELPNAGNLLKGLRSTSSSLDENQKELESIADLFDLNKCDKKEPYWEYRDNPAFMEDKTKAKKIKVEELKEDIYFSWLAHKRETGNNTEDIDKINTWGLISAPLGKRSNIKKYYYNVLSHFINDVQKLPKDCEVYQEKYDEARQEFINQLSKVRALKKQLVDDMNIESKFLNEKSAIENELYLLKEEETQIKNNMNKLHDFNNSSHRSKQELNVKIENVSKDRVELKNNIDILNRSIETSHKKIDIIERSIDNIKESIGIIEKIKYNFFNKTSLKHNRINEENEKLRVYRNELLDLHDKMTDFQNDLISTNKIHNHLRSELSVMISKIEKNEKAIDKNNKDINILISKERSLNEELDYKFTQFNEGFERIKSTRMLLDQQFWQELKSSSKDASTRAQLVNPWVTETFNRQREKLFYLALQFNKYFILSSNACRHNFNLLGMMWGYKENNNGEVPVFSQKHKDEAYPDLLSVLFLLTPVISTTFASVGRFLGNVKKEDSIGLLIVDEAGQATPQIAIGALWRSKRAIVVGDPKQVEPVVTPDTEIIMKVFSNDILKTYLDKSLSVQTFADRINPIGSTIKGEALVESNGDWVGCPLVVHRRCISPMFDISNELSYGNTMKYQTIEPDSSLMNKFIMDRSYWLDVKGYEIGQKNHFVKEQGQAVLALVKKSFKSHNNLDENKIWSKPSIYIISPFTTVVNGIKNVLKSDQMLKDIPCFEEWLNESVGTVHKFQGREASEVILVLGCDKKAMGAVKWVNRNILNVAVTRAKYRIYIIGERKIWSQSRVFQIALKYLDVREDAIIK